MKKIIVIATLVFLTGCTKGEKVTCTINNKKAEFTLKNGIISKYEIDGQAQKRSVIDELNGEYFTSSKNNDEGIKALHNYVDMIGGTCG